MTRFTKGTREVNLIDEVTKIIGKDTFFEIKSEKGIVTINFDETKLSNSQIARTNAIIVAREKFTKLS